MQVEGERSAAYFELFTGHVNYLEPYLFRACVNYFSLRVHLSLLGLDYALKGRYVFIFLVSSYWSYKRRSGTCNTEAVVYVHLGIMNNF